MSCTHCLNLLFIFIFFFNQSVLFVDGIYKTIALGTPEEQCACTCCGEVCPMGKDCCCYMPPADHPDEQPLCFQSPECASSRNPFVWKDVHHRLPVYVMIAKFVPMSIPSLLGTLIYKIDHYQDHITNPITPPPITA